MMRAHSQDMVWNLIGNYGVWESDNGKIAVAKTYNSYIQYLVFVSYIAGYYVIAEYAD